MCSVAKSSLDKRQMVQPENGNISVLSVLSINS